MARNKERTRFEARPFSIYWEAIGWKIDLRFRVFENRIRYRDA
jgi:hypothetical protein